MLVVDINLYNVNEYKGNGKQKPLSMGHVVIYNDGTSPSPRYGNYKVHAFEDSGRYIAYLEIRRWYRAYGLWRFIIRVFQGLGGLDGVFQRNDYGRDGGYKTDFMR